MLIWLGIQYLRHTASMVSGNYILYNHTAGYLHSRYRSKKHRINISFCDSLSNEEPKQTVQVHINASTTSQNNPIHFHSPGSYTNILPQIQIRTRGSHIRIPRIELCSRNPIVFLQQSTVISLHHEMIRLTSWDRTRFYRTQSQCSCCWSCSCRRCCLSAPQSSDTDIVNEVQIRTGGAHF